MAWHRLGLAYALNDRTNDLLSLADEAANHFGGALVFVHNVAKDLCCRREWSAIRYLAETIPATRREHAVALYYAGCEHVVAGDHATALTWFHRFKQVVLSDFRSFPLDEPAFNLIFRQGVLVDDVKMTRLLNATVVPARKAVTFVGPVPDGPSPFVAAHVVDPRYFRRFAGELCAGHRAAGLSAPLHFHVAAADDGIAGEMETLRAAYPDLALGFGWEAPGQWNHPVYYTCARFFVLEQLLDRYGRPVMTLDADILPGISLPRIFDAARGADFACFETGRDEPASVYQASIMVFADGGRSRAFIADLSRFCVAKLGMPPALSWMLDQAALYSVLTQRAADQPDFRFVALDKALAVSLDDAIRELATAEEKLAIISGR
ncbi:MAG: hypothetical protein NVV74_26125 [Magnetospirillum sp.]|nr:hypothetical protein [Magnetospirillum sp.]